MMIKDKGTTEKKETNPKEEEEREDEERKKSQTSNNTTFHVKKRKIHGTSFPHPFSLPTVRAHS